jgi:AcrR family transcriptional regulator
VKATSQAPISGSQRRTRAALLRAAADLLAAGGTPSVADAAEAADVSRRTAYRYFPTQEQLLTEAALESLRGNVEASFSSIVEQPARRLEAAVRTLQLETVKNERLLRTMIRLTIDRSTDDADAGGASRGTRRRDWLESALQPVRKDLSKAQHARLIAALCLCVGPEALIVLRDVVGLSHERAVDVSVWAANALLDASLGERSKKPAKG